MSSLHRVLDCAVHALRARNAAATGTWCHRGLRARSHCGQFVKPGESTQVLPNTVQRRNVATDRQLFAPGLVDAELYRCRHSFQAERNTKVLELFNAAFKRDDGQQQYIDIGCATGDFTRDVLMKKCEPCRRLVGVDISEDMVKYARVHSSHPKITYEVQDINSDVEGILEKYGAFRRVYSFYTLHWMKDQETAFKNMARLMTADGECLLLLCGRSMVCAAWREMLKVPRWSRYTEEIEKRIPVSQDVEDQSSYMKTLLQAAGLNPHTCEVLGDRWVFPTEEALQEVAMPLLPIPNDLGEQEKEDMRREYITQILNISRSRCKDIALEQSMYLVHASKGR